MDVYKLLPRTNCKACGEVSCFVFANKLVAGYVRLRDCPVLSEPQYAEQQAHLADRLEDEMPAIGRRET
jgi:ArsR family metal-binding transcriptional regulator